MTVLKRFAQLAIAAVTFLVTFIALSVVAIVVDDVPPLLADSLLSLHTLALLVGPVAMAWLVARSLGRRWGTARVAARRRLPRLVLWVLATGYALTAVIGIPAAQNRRDAWAVAEYKRISASDPPHRWQELPYFRTSVALPVLPCVIVSYHEYRLAPLYGLGSFEVAVWYGLGVKSVNFWSRWIS